MKKSFKLQDLECANCAAKMEIAIGKLPQVQAVSISFMQQRMVLEAEDATFEQTVEEAQRLMKKIEPDVRILR